MFIASCAINWFSNARDYEIIVTISFIFMFVLPLVVWYWLFKDEGKDDAKAQANYEIALANWEDAYREWQNTWICLSCLYEFMP